jgi:hypothetical protein
MTSIMNLVTIITLKPRELMIFLLTGILWVSKTAYRSKNVVNLKHKSYTDIKIPLE